MDYLDTIYGDPRFASDTITQDIVKFKPLHDGEDARFCDLVRLVNRCYNTLKEVGIASNMNNSHMLSITQAYKFLAIKSCSAFHIIFCIRFLR